MCALGLSWFLFLPPLLFMFLMLATDLVQGFTSLIHTKKLTDLELGRKVGILFRKLPPISAALLTTTFTVD